MFHQAKFMARNTKMQLKRREFLVYRSIDKC